MHWLVLTEFQRVRQPECRGTQVCLSTGYLGPSTKGSGKSNIICLTFMPGPWLQSFLGKLNPFKAVKWPVELQAVLPVEQQGLLATWFAG